MKWYICFWVLVLFLLHTHTPAYTQVHNNHTHTHLHTHTRCVFWNERQQPPPWGGGGARRKNCGGGCLISKRARNKKGKKEMSIPDVYPPWFATIHAWAAFTSRHLHFRQPSPPFDPSQILSLSLPSSHARSLSLDSLSLHAAPSLSLIFFVLVSINWMKVGVGGLGFVFWVDSSNNRRRTHPHRTLLANQSNLDSILSHLVPPRMALTI